MPQSSKNIHKFLLIGLVLFFTSFSYSYGQSKTEQLDKLLTMYLDYGQFNGSVLISENGKVFYKKGFGMANMEWDIPNEPNTKHRLGSVTKQFTAMLILQLAADKKLDLQAPISTYLPDYPKENGDKITTHHLLTHTAGIPNYTSFPGFFNELSRDPYTTDEFVKQFDEMDLEFTPGEKFSYSNSGYFLLGVIAEKLSGMSYEELLHEKIFKPLNMNDTGYDNHEDILKNRATGYEKDGNSFINANYLDMSIPYAAGSMYSTVEDLYLWDQALYTSKLAPQEYMDLYFQPHIASGEGHYAYGWGTGTGKIGNSEESIEIIEHGGGINGFNTTISRAPSDKSLIVLLNNTGGAPLYRISQAIRGIMYDKPYDLPKKSVAYEVFEMVNKNGMESGLKLYNKLKEDDTYNLSENEMNNIGYQLMGSNKLEEAAEILKLNVEAFPESFNTYDSYAEALMNLEKNDLAIKNYKKSIEMNPGNQNGIDMLKKLGVGTEDIVKEVSVPNDLLESYVGNYELKPGFVLTISKKDNQLSAQATGQPKLDIHAKSNTEFYLKEVNAQIKFNQDKKGKVESLTLFQGGQEMEGKRMND